MKDKDAFYFSHDANARNDDRILELRAAHGWAGYGIFWAIIESLHDATAHRWAMTRLGGLAMSLGTPADDLRTIIGACIELGLFVTDGESFWSPSLTRRMEKRRQLSEARAEAGRRRGANRPPDAPPPGDCDAPGEHPASNSEANAEQLLSNSSLKERKGNEGKEREDEREGDARARDAEPADIDPNNPQHIPPDVEAVVAAGAMIGKDRATCESFHAHYASQGWVKANNRPITNWPLVLRIWTVEDAAGQSPRKGGKGGSPPTTYPARMLTSDAALKLGVERGIRSWQRDWPRYRGPNGKAWHVHPDDLARPIPDGYTPWPIDDAPVHRPATVQPVIGMTTGATA